MFELISRNNKVHTRDKTALMMSFLAVIILIVIYKFFLGKLQLDAIKTALNADSVPDSTVEMANLWLISGITIVCSMTSTLGAFGVMVLDREKKLIEDFHVSPAPRFKLELSYAIFAVVFGIGLTLLSCVVSLVVFNGFDSLLEYTATDYLKIVGIASLGAVLSAAIALPILAFIRSSSAFSTLSTLVGTLIGFIAGVYVPIGTLGATLQQVMTWFPLTQANALLKQVLMESAINKVFDGAPAEVAENYRETYGVILSNPDGEHLSAEFMLLYIAAITLGLLLIHFIIKKVKR
ncbi:ABC transporter permease [Canibacter sp. lx-72]|uniref:ABC transporter permease n=1 Tax=Canibacter zhuwentaonis TaxID=2837491 RepID=UPI001BDC643C|nr:ABC transporter permease [Canibacter zhuwentaonis]MBT1018444.1 ABC transporter permease [Canibacter zhuwentaonis]MBT1035633.1 ABC transporter permease [Canibacter zhuwentaonis]